MLAAAQAGAVPERPAIREIAVELNDTAEIVRVAVTPEARRVEPRVVCDAELVRVRLDGVAARGKDVEEVDVPARGPIRHARVVPRTGGDSVVQLSVGRRTAGVCSRVGALNIGGQIVISLALAPADLARMKELSKPEPEPVAAVPVKEAAAPLPVPAKEPAPVASPARVPHVGKAGQGGAAEAMPRLARSAAPATGQRSGDDTFLLRLFGGFAFVALCAAVAYVLKRRGARSIVAGESIEILSTKRLGAHQQLVLASVQGVKFLLAVSDKTVSTLGTVGAREDQEPAKPRPSRRPGGRAPQHEEAGGELVPDSPFARELENQVGATLSAAAAQRAGSNPSNVDGLIAMARMRAGYKTRSVPPAEA